MPADRPDRPPTIRDVAALAGVSKSLVSLVLVGDPRVSETRRQAVEAAIKELGYRPNLRARALSRSRTDSVGVLINDLGNPWFIDLLAGLATTLHSAGLSPILADGQTDRRIGVASVDTFLRQDVDGLVVVGISARGGGRSSRPPRDSRSCSPARGSRRWRRATSSSTTTSPVRPAPPGT